MKQQGKMQQKKTVSESLPTFRLGFLWIMLL